jgi:sn-glycerol 3-phosphate transport system substrate-binding protein
MRFKALAAPLFAAALVTLAVPASAQTEIHWWHSMSGQHNDKINEIARGFNASQSEFRLMPVYKGSYPESMTAAIAAFRAGNPPHIVQVFEVGTATMMAAKGAIKPVTQVMQDANEPFNPKAYLPAVTGYYTDSQGNMLSMPFNSSTAIFYINRDAFKKANLDPNSPPKTWKQFTKAAEKLKAAGQSCAYTTGWPSWVHIENFSAWHNLPIGTKENGMAGLDTVFQVNTPLHVQHIATLGYYAKQGWFTYSGRKQEGEDRFISGECAMLTSSSSAIGKIRKGAKFDFSAHFLPYHDDIPGAPQNSIIGGATLWVMAGKKADEYRGVAKFFSYLSRPEVQMDWHTSTGYVPITLAAYEMTQKSGYYDKNPGVDVAIRQLNHKPPTANSKGLRFGGFVQGREVFEEELESVLQGKKNAKAAMDDAVKRGNDILRKFEAANK